MGPIARFVNFLALCLVGEPLVQFPSEYWELRNPRVESDAESSKLTLQVRDVRYPRLRGTLSVKLSFGRTVVGWRTKASGGRYVADRFVTVTNDGYLVGCHLSCTGEELKLVR